MNLRDIEKTTQDVYERLGPRFDAERPKRLQERKWLSRFQELLPSGGAILDVGCGAADPIAAYFIEQGFALTGVDFSTSMLKLARERFPNNNWIEMDMRKLSMGQQFDGIIAWHSFFHLTQEDQKATIKHFADHLKLGGALLLTVGPEEGEVDGMVGGEPVYHSSLSPNGYRQELAKYGIDIVDFMPEDPECDGSTLLLAKKVS
ncbi:methyltransferase domain-containing protein [Sneathiella sp. P13V-1]|uniref:class I SAM-dependent methyltransferase n=1 Tax=Sneathiella sp. P13V-1 TaxID=2697366 RepID=UPI00187BBE1B|nr:class I SAM-dependent methyltransferase [Sneathiella sp. P13V-1]MBE7635462.1 methyltransferase domain-containing protein [Sneathiella sp. P13V-1]